MGVAIAVGEGRADLSRVITGDGHQQPTLARFAGQLLRVSGCCMMLAGLALLHSTHCQPGMVTARRSAGLT